MKTIKFHPILFSTPMVQAILEGRKTQTRRIFKHPNYHPSKPEKELSKLVIKNWNLYDGNNELIGSLKCPYNVGDVLWVRETSFYCLNDFHLEGMTSRYFYKASFHESNDDWFKEEGYKWKPSIFMPKQACRIFLKIKSIRVERLQDISQEDAISEGIKQTWFADNFQEFRFKNYINDGEGSLRPCQSFRSLWQSINGDASWKQNPFVWVYEFEQIEKPNDFIV